MSSTDPGSPPGTEEIADALLGFVRGVGLHRPDVTPCGTPVPVAEAHALIELTGGPMGQKELGHRLDLAKSTVSRLVSQLERRGWVERWPDDADGRAARLALTAEGRTAAERLAAARRQRFAALLTAVPTAERGAVLDALGTLTAAARGTDPHHA